MCGINGVFAYHPAASGPSLKEAVTTRDHMRTRGPDGAGIWWNEDKRCVLGHRRLSVIDLSDQANQPMVLEDGAIAIVFNGEIYNHSALRHALINKGCKFKTLSDTEVVLHLYHLYGENLTEHLRGMFAFAIWDGRRAGLLLGRDCYGIKPLYTFNDGWTFRFASQVKALIAGGKVSREPEPAGIVGFHLFGAVPDPFTLYRDIRALPAGHTQWIDAVGPREPRRFCNLTSILAEGAYKGAFGSTLFPTVRMALLDSVRAHLVADVEVGLFLSAGVDSGVLLALMTELGKREVCAITLAFDEFVGTPNDEAPAAAEVAKLCGARHIVRKVGKSEFESDLPRILQAMDQPSTDGVNTWFAAKAAAEVGLKVALSGVGGDEIRAAYPSFRDIPRWHRVLKIPAAIPALGYTLRVIGSAAGVPRKLHPKSLGLLEYGREYASLYFLRRALFLPFELKHFLDEDIIRMGVQRLDPLNLVRRSLHPDPLASTSRITALESTIYMRNQLLRDSDWAGMAHSLEIRTPFADRDLLRALAPVIPTMSEKSGRAAFVHAAGTSLTMSTSMRSKTGFGVPLSEWLPLEAQSRFPHTGATSRAWARQVYEEFQCQFAGNW